MTTTAPGHHEYSEGAEPAAVRVEEWRGQWDERDLDAEEFPADAKPRLRAEARSLLAELLRPYRARIIGVFALVVGQVLATMAAPWLIGLVIDHGLPEALDGR